MAQEVEDKSLKTIRQEWRDSIRAHIKERIDEFGPDYNADSVRRDIESGNYFTLFKDNYFIGGIPLGQKIKASNSNAKFQLSISHRLTKSILPFDTYLFIQFSQKTIWNVMEESLPMRDMNFNPGIGLGHLIIHRNRYIGKAILMLEHESNGKDSLLSRSWNKVSFGINLMMSNHIDAQIKLWAPIIDSDNNRDILRYNGIGHFGINWYNDSRRLHAGLLTTWRTNSFNFNTQWELGFKLNKKENQYLFIQYYNGYGENLLDYSQYKSVVRIGFVIKSRDFTIY
ncbi:MAG: phospholipase A [Tannerella sp.]|nr:phospholipase A [Tannerella sp.]